MNTVLLILATPLAPSAYNLQNWRFIAVSSDERKQALHQVAYQQPQILDAAATIIVIGTLNAHQTLPEVLQLSVDAGIMPGDVAQGWVAAATSSHQNAPQAQRDEAIRSASMAAMNLMLAASYHCGHHNRQYGCYNLPATVFAEKRESYSLNVTG